MKVTQRANCKNAPKNQKVADMVFAILSQDEITVNEKFEEGLESIQLPSLDKVNEVLIEVAISHGKSSSCLCSYTLNNENRYIGFFLEFTTHKAETFNEIIVTNN